MARVILALLAAGLAIRFTTVPKADIERRLRALEDTNFKRELRLRTLFEEAGCTGDNLTEQRVRYAQAPNVICTLPGSTGSVIVVGAHFDFVDRGRGAFGFAAHFCFGAPLARLEGQIAFATILRRLKNIELKPGPLAWRENLGLRGLTALPLSFSLPIS